MVSVLTWITSQQDPTESCVILRADQCARSDVEQLEATEDVTPAKATTDNGSEDNGDKDTDIADLESVDSHPYDNVYPKPPSDKMYPDINCILESAARVTGQNFRL